MMERTVNLSILRMLDPLIDSLDKMCSFQGMTRIRSKISQYREGYGSRS